MLYAMARAGVFRLGGTLVGTHAFRLYAAELGELYPGLSAATDDIDIAQFAKLAIEDKADPSMAETLAALSLSPVPTVDPKNRATRWQMPGGGAVVEFLTPRMTERQAIVKLAPLGLWAQGLPFLNFLIAEPIPAVALYREGVLVQVPRPERYAIHKLIVAQRRSGPHRGKSRKDLDQAAALIRSLAGQRPYELLDAYTVATASGPAGKAAISRSLAQRPDCAAMIEALPA
ncbi:MAG TPA: GSU2403 family nucleotidyltransferase fold protein [Thermohalobaculum sp.]|nr:GSU2403 family nucleotidyltransferase fold protein [Thermohalobaculum sp.]